MSTTSPIVRPTPRTARAAKSLGLPAFWLVTALLLTGAWRVGGIMREGFAAYPTAATVAVILFALYAVPFLIFVRAVDYLEREPPLLLATAFGWGGLVATSAAVTGNAALQDLVAKLVSPEFAASWGAAIAGPTIEEVLKVLGVIAIALIARAQINSTVDGFVYGALVGLGFQVVEDIVYALNAVAMTGAGDRVSPVIVTFFLRGFLGGLWSHTLFTALAGAGVAYVIVRRDHSIWWRLLVAVGCFAGAWTCHFLWNSPLLRDGIGYGSVGLFAALLIKGIPALVVILALLRLAERREGSYYANLLSELDDPRMATPSEIEALTSLRRRGAARRFARLRHGGRGARAVRRLQRAQAHLAVELSRSGAAIRSGRVVADLMRRRREVLVRRHQLIALGVAEALAPPRRGLRRAIAAARRHSDRSGWVTVLACAALGAVGVSIAIRALGGG